AVAMTASYFVSVCVTPVACRYFLGHLAPGRFWERIEHAIDRLANGYAALLRRTLPFGNVILVSALILVSASAWGSMKLPSTFFPDIDESMERIYVRFAPGTSLEEAAQRTQAIGKRLGHELGKDNVELVLANVGSPNNARSAMTSPNWGPYMGFIRLALT